MKKILFQLVVCLSLPIAVLALPIPNCPDCVLGLYDQPQMQTNYGSMTPFVPKAIYLGITLGAGQPGLTGIEFSIAGMRQVEDGIFVLSVDGVTSPPPNILINSPPAPADTSVTSVQTGGMNIAWPSCIVGSQSLVKITLISFTAVTNKVFRVMHRFPPSNVDYGRSNPILIGCDVPGYFAVRVLGGCYIAGWDGTTQVPCTPIDIPVAATPAAWGAVKGLYR